MKRLNSQEKIILDVGVRLKDTKVCGSNVSGNGKETFARLSSCTKKSSRIVLVRTSNQ